MLEDGRLEPLLKEELQKAKAGKSGQWAREEADRVRAAWQRTCRGLYNEANQAVYNDLRAARG